jgi:hypothetical protein
MAQIRLYDLDPVGSELFQDAENYLNELNEEEIDRVWTAIETALSFTFSKKRRDDLSKTIEAGVLKPRLDSSASRE